MTTYEACRSDLLIFAVSEFTSGIDAALIRMIGSGKQSADPQMMVVKTAGEAMRLIHRHQPRLLFLCVELEDLERSTALIDVVHRRRPQLPVIAITAEHGHAVERAVRAAGAAYYFALDGQAEDQQLRDAMRELGLVPSVTRSGLSPPTSRAGPPRRRRRPRAGRSSYD